MSLQGSVAAKNKLVGSVNFLHTDIVNAYEIAVKNGFEGTEEEWLASLRGEAGAVFVPYVDSNGNLSWSNNGGLVNPAEVNIKGADGKPGKDGTTPVKGVDYYTEEDKKGLAEEVRELLAVTDGVDLSNLENGTWTETINGEVVNHTSIFSEDFSQVTIDGVVVKLR